MSITDYISTAQAAQNLGVTREYVTRLCQLGRIATVRMGRAYWMLPADLEVVRGLRRGCPRGRRLHRRPQKIQQS